MRSVKLVGWLVGALSLALAVTVGCSSDDGDDTGTGGTPGTGGTGQGGGNQGGTNQGGANQGGANQGGANQGGANQGGANQGGSGQGGSAGSQPTACTVEAGSNEYTAYKGTVLAPHQVIDNGTVLVDDKGFIACVAADCAADTNYANARKVTCADAVISPGLINPHDHTTFANNPPYGTADYNAVKDVRYDHRHQWRKGQDGKPKIGTASGASAGAQTAAELRFMMSGATSINGSNGAAGVLRNLDQANAKLEGLSMPALKYETFPLGDSGGETQTTGCSYPGATTTNEAQGFAFFTPHVAEGINAAARNEFVCQSTGNYDLLFKTSGWIHGIGLIADDVKLFSSELTKLIWSPRSNVSLYGDTARIPVYHKAGAIVALGTDWVASGSMNMQRELQCARDLNAQWNSPFSDEDLWRMVTMNGAFATGFEKGLGMLKKGYVADISIFNATVNKTHAAVTKAGLADTMLVLRGGRPMYGDSQLMTDLGKAACEDMPAAADAAGNSAWAKGVCGVEKKACINDDPSVGDGLTLASVTAEIAKSYPLYFCGTPDKEPSCSPKRPNQYPAAADDKDGDGVVDGSDNCPDAFNPIRPIDENKQRDFDGDTQGDECDACPFDANNSQCTYSLKADDVDGDTVKNGDDNCPMLSNSGQQDGDSDGKGDACDSCPAEANPGPAACPASAKTVEQIRTSAVQNDLVLINEAVVLGVRSKAAGMGNSNGFYISDPTPGAGRCIFVHTASTVPTVKVGDRIKIEGKFAIFNGLEEITNPTISNVVAGAALPELAASVADLIGANSGGYQSCRVVLTNVNGVADGTAVALEQSGSKVRASNFIWAGSAFVTAGTVYTSAKGFMGIYQSTPEFLPQTDADLAK